MILRENELHHTHFIAHFSLFHVRYKSKVQLDVWCSDAGKSLLVKLDHQNSNELQVIYGDSCVQMHPRLCVIFSDMLRSCWPSAERPDWRITPLRMSMTSYSICLQLRSLSEGRCFQKRDFFCCHRSDTCCYVFVWNMVSHSEE
jgi:hypothetical protein